MKKVIIIMLMASVSVFLLSGCGGSSKNEGNTVMKIKNNRGGKYFSTQKVTAEAKMTNVKFDRIVWESDSEDLNGDGDDDEVVIFAGEDYFMDSDDITKPILTVCINKICFERQVNWPEESYFGEETEFEVIDVDKKDDLKELLLSYREGNYEDPDYHHVVVRFLAGNMMTLSSFRFSSEINFDDDSFTIQHSRYPIIVGTYALGNRYVKRKKFYRQPDSEVDHSQMAACPYVYLSEDTSKVYQGEILRNLNVDTLESWQDLELETASKKYNSIKVIVSEEKDEITFLNAVYLMADGDKYLPEISESRYSKIIADDNDYLIMKKGEAIELEFNLRGKAVKEVKLFAKGYYLPAFTL